MKRLTLLIIIILTAGLLPAWLLQPWDLEGLFNCDVWSQEYPFILETRRVLRSGSLPLWSWNTFTGDSMAGAYSFYTLTSPFVWLQCLLPASWVAPSFWPVLYLKVIALGLAARLYLRRMEFDATQADAGALMYAFSSFTLANLYYWHFMEPAILFPLLLYGVERAIAGGPRQVAALAAIVWGVVTVNFYFGAGSLIAAGIYLVFRVWGRPGALRAALRCMAGVIAGVMLAAPLAAVVLAYFADFGRAGESSFPLGLHALPLALRRAASLLVPRIIEGNVHDFNPLHFTSAGLWLPFVGALPAILYAWHSRGRLARLLLLLLVLYIIYPLGGLFTLFRDPLYCRWGYAVVLVLIVATLRGAPLVSRASVKLYTLMSAAVVIILWIMVWLLPEPDVPAGVRVSGMSALVLLLMGVSVWQLMRWAARGCTAPLMLRYTTVVSTLSVLASGMAYLHSRLIAPPCFGIAPIAWMADQPGGEMTPGDTLSDTLRRRLNCSGIVNYALLTGRPTASGYSSAGPACMVPFYEAINMEKGPYPAILPTRHYRSVMTLLSMSEAIYSTTVHHQPLPGAPLQLKAAHGNLRIYTYAGALPVGVAYDSYLPASEVLPLVAGGDTIDLPALMLHHLVLTDTAPAAGLLTRATLHPELYAARGRASAQLLDSVAAARSRWVATDFRIHTRGWSCVTRNDAERMMFFSVSHAPGFRYYIDGREVEGYEANLGMTALRVPAGEHRIAALFSPPGLSAGMICGVVGLLLVLLMVLPRRKRDYQSNTHTEVSDHQCPGL